jgi:DNA polymerase-4
VRIASQRLHLEHLSAYAPELNPDEGVWAYWKGVELRNLCCFDVPHLRHELRDTVKRLRRKPYSHKLFPRGRALAVYARVSSMEEVHDPSMIHDQPLTIASYPRAIVHIDGDAFFASCEQARNPKLQGRPVVTGKERGIAASMSYEAKAQGVVRGMRLADIRRVCPEAVILPSDYETYSLLSKRLFPIVRRYTPDVEEYSIDECFADLTGLRRPLRMSYERMAGAIKNDLDTELGFTFSVGLAPNKVLAKIASKWQKPSGLTAIPGWKIHLFLATLPIEKVWGIGPQTAALLAKHRMRTALEYARAPEAWVRRTMTKPLYQIWQELNGKLVMELELTEKASYQSIQKMKTFSPPSSDKAFVFAQLSKNIENACIKARRYRLAAAGIIIFLRQQDFRDRGLEIRLSRATAFPHDMMPMIAMAFEQLFNPREQYRSTGVIFLDLREYHDEQLDLFGASLQIEKMARLYQSVDQIKAKYGKHTLFLGSSFYAHRTVQHEGERGMLPQRTRTLLRGETRRKRLGLPMLMEDVW